MGEITRYDYSRGAMSIRPDGEFIYFYDHLAAMREKDAEIGDWRDRYVDDHVRAERAEAQRDALLKVIWKVCARRTSTEDGDHHSEQWRQGFACAANMLRAIASKVEKEK